MARELEITDILEKIRSGGKTTRPELERVASATLAFVQDFLAEAYRGPERVVPKTQEYEDFKKCLKGMTDVLLRAGLVDIPTMQFVWARVEEAEK